jgi:hypothetical protein
MRTRHHPLSVLSFAKLRNHFSGLVELSFALRLVSQFSAGKCSNIFDDLRAESDSIASGLPQLQSAADHSSRNTPTRIDFAITSAD